MKGVLCTVTAIKTHHIAVQFDGRKEPYCVERVKARFLVLKFVQQKQFPVILVFAVTVLKCQGLLLDCVIMDLSKKCFVQVWHTWHFHELNSCRPCT